MEMVCAIVHQLTRDLTVEQIKAQGFEPYFVDHTLGLWPQAASGTPFSATVFQSKGDAITDLHENMAAEQKARTTYDNIIRLVDDPDVLDPIRFLRQREIVHFQRFGETKRTRWKRKNRAADKEIAASHERWLAAIFLREWQHIIKSCISQFSNFFSRFRYHDLEYFFNAIAQISKEFIEFNNGDIFNYDKQLFFFRVFSVFEILDTHITLVYDNVS